jgi:DNA-binding NarL/FixJ family response regulator
VKIFFVEDNAGFRTTLSQLIARIPGACLVGWADDAPEAVSAIHKLQPDVLLVDLMLTSTSGFQVLRSVRRASLGTACLVVTNMVSPGLRALCMTLGAQGVFDKTLELDALSLALHELVSTREISPPTAAMAHS